jgi:signal transduction histidine kinase
MGVSEQTLATHGEASSSGKLDLEAMPDPVIVASMSGRLVAMNELAEALVGYDRHEVVGDPVDQLLTFVDGRRDFASQLRVEFISAFVRHKAGHQVPVELMLCPDLFEHVVVITLRARRVRDERSSIRDEDVAALGHDLRGPLSVISLEIAMLGERLEAASSNETASSLARIGRNLAFVDHMLHDLLDLASIDAARFRIVREPTELVGRVVDVVERMVPTRDRERVSVEAPPRVTVLADARRIERVICNFLHNALKYAPPRSPISVHVEVVGSRARVSVVDQGPGLAPDEARRVFDKFRRARSAQTHDGAGLGLYVSRKIIEAHGGQIGVQSSLGNGSRFFFELGLTDARPD